MKHNVETILDLCIADMRSGKSLDAVLASHPEFATELRPLLEMSLDLAQLPEPQPSINGLMRALAHRYLPQRPQAAAKRFFRFPFYSAPMLLRVVASIAAIFLIGWGVSFASAQTVPGDWMYPVKRIVERVKLALTINASNQAELRISFSEQRMSEAVRKYERGEGLDDALLRSMLEESRLAIQEALSLDPQERAYMISRVGYLSAHQKNMIETVKRTADATTRPVAEAIGNDCTQRMKWMEGMMQDMEMTPPSCSGCWCTPQSKVSSAKEGASEAKGSPSKKQMQRWMDNCPGCGN